MRKLGTTVFVLLFSVAVAVSTHLCVVYRHFRCPMSLFQGHVASVSKFNLPGPQETGQSAYIYVINGDAPIIRVKLYLTPLLYGPDE